MPSVATDPLQPLLRLPGVRAAADGARGAVDALRAHRVLRRRSTQVSAESALHGARASAALDGADYSLAQVRTGELTDPVLQGALRVSSAIGGLVGTWRTAPLQVLARLHLLAATDLTDRLGRPVLDDRGRLAGLAELVVAGPDVPAVVLAAVVQGELLAVAPFEQGNGVVARAAARLTMVAYGLDPKALSVPEVGHYAARADYQAALGAYGSGTPDGVARWIVHCCAAVERGAQEGLAICEALLRG
jgi:hypothetical protein